MRNIFKKSLLFIAASMVAGSILAQVQSFSAAEIVAGTQKGAVTASTTFAIKNSAQICKTGSQSTKVDVVEGNSSASGVDEKYVQIVSTSQISKLYLHATYNSSGSGKKMVFVYWAEGVTPTIDNVLSAELVTFPGYDGACDANYVTVTPPAGARTLRIYRQLKNFDGTGYKKGTNWGDNTTYFIVDMDVTAGPAPKSTDATLSDLQVGGVTIDGFSSSKTDYTYTIAATATTMPSVTATKHDSKASDPVITQATMPTVGNPTQATVVVTAEDGTTKMTYTITFTRAELSHDATLKAIMVDGNAIQGFSPSTKTYNVTVPYSQTAIPVVTATTNFSAATYIVTNPSGVEGTATIVVTAEDGTTKETYTVNITKATPSNDATLKSLSYSGTSIPGFSSSQLTYSVDIQSGSAVPLLQGVANHSFATISYQQVTSLNGTATATVTAEDGTTTKTYSVTFKEIVGPPVPQTGLTLHVPEIYEAKEIAGGYGTPLTAIDGHEYEVYYAGRVDNGGTKLTIHTIPIDKSQGITKNETSNSYEAIDGWFKGTGTDKGTGFAIQDEFNKSTDRCHNMKSSNSVEMHFKGYDQFSLYGIDKKINPSKPTDHKVFKVLIDDVEQTMEPSTSATIRRFDITTGEHVIKIQCGDDCLFGGFSLRVAQEPRTKWLKGNDSTQKVNAFGTINPITYVTKYNNIAGAETKLEWLGTAVDGIALQKIEGDLTDTLILSGTANAPIGEYKYAVVAYYNGVETSRAEGKFKVKYEIKAITEADVEADQGEEMDAIKCRYYVYDATTDIIFKWINGLDAPGVTTSAKNGIYTIGGTPTTVGTYHYLVTVTGGDTIMGTISVKSADLGVNPILYLYKNTFAYEKDYVYTYLKNSGYNLREKKAKDDLRPANQYAKYKWILISEDVDANNPEVYKILRGGSHLPVLNMNAFSYAHPIDSLTPEYGGTWGEPNNGSLSENGKSITVLRDDHPIFSKMHKKQGDQIQVLDSIDRKGLMPIKVNKQGSLCLATALTRDREDYYGDGELETFLHEIPAGLDGNNTKYICFPLSMNSSKYMTAEGKNLLNAVIAYLTNEQEASVERPELRITEFKLGDIEIIPEIGSYSIMLEIDTLEHPELADLSAVTPEITLASEYTHTIPAQGEPVNLSIAEYLPFEYVVSDYIHREVYEITVVYRKPQGIEDVYTAGEWVNIFDIYGRKVTTTNEDIYSMPLPRGMYIVVTANGQTLKIMR